MTANTLYRVMDDTGDVWGHVAAAAAEKAISIVAAEVAAHPERYLGTPHGLRALAVQQS